jgi:hypothetical protein
MPGCRLLGSYISVNSNEVPDAPQRGNRFAVWRDGPRRQHTWVPGGLAPQPANDLQAQRKSVEPTQTSTHAALRPLFAEFRTR